MRTHFKVSGLADLDAKLGDLGDSMGKNVLRRAGRKALQPFDEAWRAGAPHLTGQLEESGSVGSKLARSQRKAHERQNTVEVFAGPGPNPQAIQKEFGNYKMPAEPFARPAWEETKGQVLPILVDELGAEVMKAVKRRARKKAKAAAAAEGE